MGFLLKQTWKKRMARRYAQALFGLCREKGSLKPVQTDLQKLSELAQGVKEFRSFLENPGLSPSQHRDIFQEAFRQTFDPLTLKFLRFLESKKRLPILPEICAAFDELCLQNDQMAKAELISAYPLSETQLESIRNRLAERARKEIILNVKVRPSLIGGFRIFMEDRVYDFSVSHLLNQFKDKILHTSESGS